MIEQWAGGVSCRLGCLIMGEYWRTKLETIYILVNSDYRVTSLSLRRGNNESDLGEWGNASCVYARSKMRCSPHYNIVESSIYYVTVLIEKFDISALLYFWYICLFILIQWPNYIKQIPITKQTSTKYVCNFVANLWIYCISSKK